MHNVMPCEQRIREDGHHALGIVFCEAYFFFPVSRG